MKREDYLRLISSEKPLFSDLLSFDLEERKDLIKKNKREVKYVSSQLDNFYEDVYRIISYNMPVSMISHQAYNLIHNLSSCLVGLTIYDFLITSYLLYDDYDDNYEMWNKYRESAKNVIAIIKKLGEVNIFNKENNSYVENLSPTYNKEKNAVYSLLKLENSLSIINGVGLLNALLYYLRTIENKLEIIKTGINDLTDEDFESIYQANYALYFETYWLIEGENFRGHIEEHYFRGRESKIEILEKLLRDERFDFENNGTGTLWRDYYHDKKKLYFEMRRAKLNEEQWKYFFKKICRFEEYEKWIEELEHPKIEEKNFPMSSWDKIFNDAIDVRKVKLAINELLPKTMSITAWYIIFKIFEEIDWLQDSISTHFISWVKDVYGWNFKTEDFKSSVNSELKQQHTLDWDTRTMTSAKVALDHINFAKSVRCKFISEMDGKTVIEDNKYYFKNQNLYISHTKR